MIQQGFRGIRVTPLMTLAILSFFLAAGTFAQDAANPASTTPEPSPGRNGTRHQKYSHADDFLIRGTVFTDQGLSFPGVNMRIRRSGEKKSHWETITNSRGEFAVRIPRGAEYEMVASFKGFHDETDVVNAKNGDMKDNIVIRMKPAAGDHK